MLRIITATLDLIRIDNDTMKYILEIDYFCFFLLNNLSPNMAKIHQSSYYKWYKKYPNQEDVF